MRIPVLTPNQQRFTEKPPPKPKSPEKKIENPSKQFVLPSLSQEKPYTLIIPNSALTDPKEKVEVIKRSPLKPKTVPPPPELTSIPKPLIFEENKQLTNVQQNSAFLKATTPPKRKPEVPVRSTQTNDENLAIEALLFMSQTQSKPKPPPKPEVQKPEVELKKFNVQQYVNPPLPKKPQSVQNPVQNLLYHVKSSQAQKPSVYQNVQSSMANFNFLPTEKSENKLKNLPVFNSGQLKQVDYNNIVQQNTGNQYLFQYNAPKAKTFMQQQQQKLSPLSNRIEQPQQAINNLQQQNQQLLSVRNGI